MVLLLLRHRTQQQVLEVEAEIGQLVVQQETRRHHPRPETVLDGGGHGERVALPVHDRDMRGGWQFRRQFNF